MTNRFLIAAALAALLPSAPVFAATISVNFSTSGNSMSAGDVAGLNYNYTPGALTTADTQVANWNDVTAAASGSGIALNKYADGSAAAATLGWSGAFGGFQLNSGSPAITGDDKMWKGFLDIQSASVTVSGLSFTAPYSVIVYFDGQNDANWRTATYTIGGASFTAEDSENTNWKNAAGQNTAGIYQAPVAGGTGNAAFTGSLSTGNNNEGNYLVFSGVTGSSFTLNAAGAAGNLLRAPINGFQIVGATSAVPEPSAYGLIGAGALAGVAVLRRRRKA